MCDEVADATSLWHSAVYSVQTRSRGRLASGPHQQHAGRISTKASFLPQSHTSYPARVIHRRMALALFNFLDRALATVLLRLTECHYEVIPKCDPGGIVTVESWSLENEPVNLSTEVGLGGRRLAQKTHVIAGYIAHDDIQGFGTSV